MGKRKRPIEFLLNDEGIDLSQLSQVEEENENDFEEEEDDEKISLEEKEEDCDISLPQKPQDEIKRLKLLRTVQLYQKWLPNELKELRLEELNLSEMTCKELEDKLGEIRFLIQAASQVGFNYQLLQVGISIIEGMGINSGLRIEGLSRSFENDPEMNRLLKEISLLQAEDGFICTSPYERLCFLIVSKCHQLHCNNTIANENARLRSTFLSEDFINKWRDL